MKREKGLTVNVLRIGVLTVTYIGSCRLVRLSVPLLRPKGRVLSAAVRDDHPIFYPFLGFKFKCYSIRLTITGRPLS